MHAKERQHHQLNVPRALIYAAMEDILGLKKQKSYWENCRTIGKKSKIEKGSFTSKGTSWVFSFDGHDKLMGFQSSLQYTDVKT